MIAGRTIGTFTAALFTLLSTGSALQAAGTAKLTGALAGYVRDSAGVPRMGATVLLFNRYDRLLSKAVTNENGAFDFPALYPDLYSVRVTLTSFVPAVKQQIAIQPGMRSVLSINLASVLSSIELIYSTASEGIMSDEWKWVLRSSMATRPILRFTPAMVDISDPNRRERFKEAVFADTRGLVKISSGEAGPYSMFSNQPDLGTSFALATSVFGSNNVQVAGNVGYSAETGIPAAAFRTSFRRNEAGLAGPEVNLTVRQLSLPGRTGAAFSGTPQDGAPMLRTLSLGVKDRVQITDGVQLDYGASIESVQFFDRLNYLSPFARLTYDFGHLGSLELGYSSGAPPAELMAAGNDSDADLQRDIAALSLFPRVSLRSGRARVQRAQNFEIGYHKVAGSRHYSFGVFRESVANATLTVAGAQDVFAEGELLPDLASRSSVFNAGNFERLGVMASFTQALSERWNVGGAYGTGGGLTIGDRELEVSDAGALRSAIRGKRRQWAMAQVSGTIPGSGTRFTSSYQWTDSNSIIPGHIYVTQRVQALLGWNVRIHQPIGTLGLFPGRLEATAELRNMLAQGYLPIKYTDGSQLLLMQSPRAVRGGFSFIF